MYICIYSHKNLSSYGFVQQKPKATLPSLPFGFHKPQTKVSSELYSALGLGVLIYFWAQSGHLWNSVSSGCRTVIVGWESSQLPEASHSLVGGPTHIFKVFPYWGISDLFSCLLSPRTWLFIFKGTLRLTWIIWDILSIFMIGWIGILIPFAKFPQPNAWISMLLTRHMMGIWHWHLWNIAYHTLLFTFFENKNKTHVNTAHSFSI